MDRFSYLIRRLLLAVPTFLGITLVCFALTRVLPGGPVEMRLARLRGLGSGEGGGVAAERVAAVTEEQRQALTRQFGFDQPFLKQYARWLLRDAMGLRMRSYDFPDRSAGELIASRFPISLWFGITGFVLAYLVCIPLGWPRPCATAPLRCRHQRDCLRRLRPAALRPRYAAEDAFLRHGR